MKDGLIEKKRGERTRILGERSKESIKIENKGKEIKGREKSKETDGIGKKRG